MSDYETFQLQWMIDREHSLRELMEELQSLQYEDPEDSDRISTPITELFAEGEAERGFGSEIWPCEAEYESREKVERYLAHALNLLVVFPFRLDFLSPSDSPDFLCYTIIQVDGELQSRSLPINSCCSLLVSFPVFYSPIQVFKCAHGGRFRRGSSTRSKPRRHP